MSAGRFIPQCLGVTSPTRAVLIYININSLGFSKEDKIFQALENFLLQTTGLAFYVFVYLIVLVVIKGAVSRVQPFLTIIRFETNI